MTLYNLQRQPLNNEVIKAQLKNLNKWPPPKVEEVEKALAEYYLYAMQLLRHNYIFDANVLPSAILDGRKVFLPGIGSQLLEDMITIIQGRLCATATANQIIDEAINALASVIPGSVFIEAPAKIVTRYLATGGALNNCRVCNTNG